ncbi:MAG: hypothetical protein FJ403_00840 [Verrucomicrobia bacterium]|nr:hypothetical protein [Verrucomicrobiota bacterium]
MPMLSFDGRCYVVNGLGPVTDGAARTSDRVLDWRLILDELARGSAGILPLAQHADLERVGAFGFTIGGFTAAELCRIDARCKASANIHGRFWGPVTDAQTQNKPLIIFRADESDGDVKNVYEELQKDGFWLKVAKTIRWNFNLNGLIFEPEALVPLGAVPPEEQISGVRVSQITRTYLVSFFNKYLKNQDDHLFDGPLPTFPEVKEFLKE